MKFFEDNATNLIDGKELQETDHPTRSLKKKKKRERKRIHKLQATVLTVCREKLENLVTTAMIEEKRNTRKRREQFCTCIDKTVAGRVGDR